MADNTSNVRTTDAAKAEIAEKVERQNRKRRKRNHQELSQSRAIEAAIMAVPQKVLDKA